MKILVLNCGSSSIKYQLFDMSKSTIIAQGGIEKLGLPGSFLKFTLPSGEKVVLEKLIPEHTAGVKFILETLQSAEYGCIKSLDEITAVGHRVVHGGEKFNESVVITDEVIKQVEVCSDLAPLHNPANLKGIATISELLPNVPQVGVFDTAFHQTMPDYAYTYALPYKYYTDYGIRRYGFHGTSHRYVSQKAIEYLNLDPNNSKIITCHIGNGASFAAVVNGKSVDTTMGMTPVEGLMMGTRSGDVDAGVLTYLMDKEGLDAAGVSEMVNKKSGLMGISEFSSDMREINAAIAEGNKRALLARSMFYYRIKKYVGAYAAAMGGVDAIVFTGGVGENSDICRASTCKDLGFMGVEIDLEKNEGFRGTGVISKPESRVKVVVIPTDEEYMIAYDTKALLNL